MAIEHIIEHFISFTSTVIIYYFRTYGLIKSAVTEILTPLTNRFDLFEILIFWTILTLIVNSLVVKTRYAIKHGFRNTVVTWFVRKIRKIPFIEAQIDKELVGISKGLDIDINKHRDPVKTLELPQQGISEEALRRKLQGWQKIDYKIYGEKKITGCLYYNESEKLHGIVKDIAKDYLYINPLHFDLFPTANQMEGEIISMVKKLFYGDDEACGIITSGGTESIMSAMLAYREWGKARGIEEPEILAPITAHVAFNKAAFYYGMMVRSIPVDMKTGVCNIADIEKAINKNTVCIVGSFPNYPYGTVDQIEELSNLAKRKGIGFHCDCCLGSFLVPFADKFGVNTGLFDFRLPGVTSISVDPHKYGLAPKGISVCLFRNKNLRRGTIYSCISWPGGIYATPTHAGSRGHSPIAGAWVAMMSTGYNGYMDKAGKIIEATRRCVKKLSEINGIEVVGNPELGVVSFVATHKNLSCYDLAERLGQRGWKLAALQKPPALHLSITNYNLGQVEDFLAAVKWGVAEVIKAPPKKKGNLAQIYGSAQVLPENLVEDGARVLVEAVLKP